MGLVSRRTFLIGSLAAAWRVVSGLAAEADQGKRPQLIGYGLVNGWPYVDHSRLADLLGAAGLTLTGIEYVPWFDASGAAGESTRTDVTAAARLVRAMRPRNITTFINIVNWNGQGQRAQSDQWFRERVVEIREQVGADQVLLQAVSEPHTNIPNDKARRWQQMARQEWPGQFVVYAESGVSPVPFFAGAYDYLDVHHCSYESMLDHMRTYGPRVIANTDCTPLLARNLGADRAARLVRHAIDHRTNLLIYDGDRLDIDELMLAKMGESTRQ